MSAGYAERLAEYPDKVSESEMMSASLVIMIAIFCPDSFFVLLSLPLGQNPLISFLSLILLFSYQ